MKEVASYNGKRAVGTVIQPFQLLEKHLKRIIKDSEVPKILLFRANTVERVISAKRHRRLRDEPHEEAYSKELRVSANDVLHRARKWKRWYEFLEKNLMSSEQLTHVITYEMLLFQSKTNILFIVDQLKRFMRLGPPNPPPQIPMSKSSTGCPTDHVKVSPKIARLAQNSSVSSVPYISRCPI